MLIHFACSHPIVLPGEVKV